MLDRITTAQVQAVLDKMGYQIDDEDSIEDLMVMACNALLDLDTELEVIKEQTHWTY